MPTKHSELLTEQCKDLSERYELLKEQVEQRRKKFENSIEILEKFSSEFTRFTDGISVIQEKLDNFDASYKKNIDNLSLLKQLEADCKNVENLLLSKQGDLRSLKLNYQNYTQITGLFSKELQQFISKFKKSTFKRLSSDLESDLSHLRSCLNDADQKYNVTIEKLNLLKESLHKLVENQKQFSDAHQKCEVWLKETEINVNSDINRFESVKLCDDITQLQSVCDLFNKYNVEISSNKKLIEDLKKSSQNLFLNHPNFDKKSSLTQRVDSITQRYAQLENVVNKQLEEYVEKLTYLRNLKENFKSIQSWLTCVEKNYEELLNDGPVNNIDDKINSLKHLKQDLETRKEYLTQNLNSKNNSQHREQIERYNSLLNSINKQHESFKLIGELLENFEKTYIDLDEFCKNCACKIDTVNHLDRHQEPNYDSTIGVLGDINNDLKSKSKQLKHLESILSSIEIKVHENKISSKFDLSSLNEDLVEIQSNFEQLNTIINLKVNDLVLLNNTKQKYIEVKGKCEKWLKDMELKVHTFDPLAIDIEIIERQYNELENLLELYRIDGKTHMDKLNDYGAQYIAFVSKQHSSNTKLNESLLNDNIEIENEIKKLNDLYTLIGECLDERRHDVLDSLDKMKYYLQDLHRLDSLLNEYDTKLNKIFTYSTGDNTHEVVCLNSFPTSRLILTHILSSVKKLGTDINSLNNEIEKFKLKSKQFIFDRATNDRNGIEDIKKQLKELVDKYSSLNNSFLERKEKCELHFGNFEAYEILRDELRQSLESKLKTLESFQLNLNLNDLTAIESQIKQIESIKSDLSNKDCNTYENLHRYVDLLNESSFKRDSKFVKTEVEKLKEKYDYLLESYKNLLNYKQQIKDSSLNFSDIKLKFYETLNKIDSRLNELNLASSLFSQSADLIIHELEHIEKHSLNECSILLTSANECVTSLCNLQQQQQMGIISEEIKQNLIHMKTSYNNTMNNLNTLKRTYEDIVQKEDKFNTINCELAHFIEERLSSPQLSEPISANYEKLQKQCQAHNKFSLEVDKRRADVKSHLEQAHSEMNNNKSDSIKQEITQKLQTIEISWNNLLTKIDNYKEKLNVCFELAEQFKLLSTDLTQWLGLMNKRLQTSMDPIQNLNKYELERRLKEDELFQRDLSQKLNDLKQLISFGSDLQMCAQCDQKCVEEEIDSIKEKFNSLQNDNKNQIQTFNDLLQRFNEYEETVNDLKKSLKENENKLNTLAYDNKDLKNMNEYKALQQELQQSLKQKIDLCNDIAKGLTVDTQDSLVTSKLVEISTHYDNIDKKIGDKLQQVQQSNEELEGFNKEVQNLTNVENYIDQLVSKPLILDVDSLKAQQNQLNQAKNELNSINSEHKRLSDKHKHLVSKSVISWNDALKEQLNNLSKRSLQFDNKIKTHDRSLVHTVDKLHDIKDKMEKLKANMALIQSEIDQSSLFSNSNNSANSDNLIAEYKQFERNRIEPVRDELKSI